MYVSYSMLHPKIKNVLGAEVGTMILLIKKKKKKTGNNKNL